MKTYSVENEFQGHMTELAVRSVSQLNFIPMLVVELILALDVSQLPS